MEDVNFETEVAVLLGSLPFRLSRSEFAERMGRFRAAGYVPDILDEVERRYFLRDGHPDIPLNATRIETIARRNAKLRKTTTSL